MYAEGKVKSYRSLTYELIRFATPGWHHWDPKITDHEATGPIPSQ
jgi:hypothetical protein